MDTTTFASALLDKAASHLHAAAQHADNLAARDADGASSLWSARPTCSSGPGSRRPAVRGCLHGQPAVSTTTAADLLNRADLLVRELRNSSDPVSLPKWERFDITAYRPQREGNS